MPLWKRLAIILSGVLLVVTVAIARVEYLPQISPEPPAQDNYAAEIYQRYLESLKASLLLAREWIGESFGNFVEVIERNDEFVVAMSTVLIAVFTIILGVATWLLWRATKKLVRGAEETAKRQLRAYISYKGGHFIDIDVAAFAANKIPQCELILINQGKTPAKNLKIYQRAWVTANPEFTTNPDFFLIAPFEESFREGTMKFFSPRAEFPISIRLSRKLEAAEFEHFKIGSIIYRAAFHITYDDVFGEHHFYKFGRSAALSTVHGMIYYQQWDGEKGDDDTD